MVSNGSHYSPKSTAKTLKLTIGSSTLTQWSILTAIAAASKPLPEKHMPQKPTQSSPESASVPSTSEPAALSIGGFLYVVGSLLLLNCFFNVFLLAAVYTAFPAGPIDVMLIQLSPIILQTLLLAYVLFVFFKKSKIFPQLLRLAAFSSIILSFFMTPFLLFILVLAFCSFIIQYSRVSRRVAATFTR